MAFLILLVLSLTFLQGEDWPKPPSWSGELGSVFLTWGGVAALVILGALFCRRAGQVLQREPDRSHGALRRFGRLRRYHFFGQLGFYLAALYLLGWGWTARHVLVSGLWFLPGVELLLLAPFFTGLFFSWSLFYDVERQAHALAASGEEPGFMGRWTYVGLQARQNLLLIVPPLVLLLVQQAFLRFFPSLQKNETFMTVFGVTLLVGAFVSIPWLLRVLLGLKPLPEGSLRSRLLTTAGRLKFRFNDILLWDTKNTVANAMVTGPLPFLRYVVVTDRLVRDLSEEEVEAVFGHEVGHIKHHHMTFYLLFLLGSLVALAGVWRLAVGFLKSETFYTFHQQNLPWLSDWLGTFEALAVIPLLTVVAVYIVVVFGYLSRRCERQADIFGCRTVSVPAFISALEKVADLNGMSRDKPGWLSSWQHSTIARRVDFLQRMTADPRLEPSFQLRVGLVKWGVALGLAGILVALGPAKVWEILRHF
jgi:STE24 endopeptidase